MAVGVLGLKAVFFPEVSENYVTAKVTAKRVKRFSDAFVPTDTLIMQRVMIGRRTATWHFPCFIDHSKLEEHYLLRNQYQ